MTTPSNLFGLQIRAFVLTWVSYATYYLTRKNLAVVKSRLHDELGFSVAQLGSFDTVYLLAYALGQFGSGVLGDRIGPRRLIALGMIGSALCSCSFGLSSAFLPMFLAFAINGIFQSTGWPGTVKAMQPFFGSAQRGGVMGLWSTNYQVGGLLATALATYLLSRLGWRAAFLLPALWVAGIGLVVYFFLIEKPPASLTSSTALKSSHDIARPAPPIRKDFRILALLREPLLLSIGAAYFGLKLIRYSLLFWLPYYLHHHFRYSESQAGYLSLPFEIGGIIGAIAIGWLSDRCCREHRMRVATPTLFFLSCALFAYQWYGGHSPLWNALLLGSVGFLLFGPDTLISGAVAQEVGGAQATARVAGVINGIGSIGAICSPLLVAWSIEHFGWSFLFFGFVGVAFIATLCLGIAQTLQARV